MVFRLKCPTAVFKLSLVNSMSTDIGPTCTVESNPNQADDKPINSSEENIATHPEVSSTSSYQRIDSKLILQNMEEVLHTVKRQHREKHRRKKEQKKLTLMEASAATELPVTQSSISKVEKSKHKHRHKERIKIKKTPLREGCSQDNINVSLQSSSENGTILQHFQRSPKKGFDSDVTMKRGATEIVQILVEDESNEKCDILEENMRVTNAFEVMMNARNKSIGSNSPGKEQKSPEVNEEHSDTNAKRKAKLQEWAERKGGIKRKVEEEAREMYLEEQLNLRAKRFKEMLINGAKAPSTSTAVKSEKTKSLRKVGTSRKKRTVSIDFSEALECSISNTDTETVEYLDKLSSPTKKPDDLLGHFPKKDSRKSRATKTLEAVYAETRGRTRKSSIINTDSPSCILVNNADTHNGRPRRSCAGKSRYDYYLEKNSRTISRTGKPNIFIDTSECRGGNHEKGESNDIIVLDDSLNEQLDTSASTPQTTPKKLAPLFIRSLPKQNINPEILKARQAFLHSGVPEKLRIEQEKQKQSEQNYEDAIELFPRISHIQQLPKQTLVTGNATLITITKLRSEGQLSPLLHSTQRSRMKLFTRRSFGSNFTDCVAKDFQIKSSRFLSTNTNYAPLPILLNKRDIIKSWKVEFEPFRTYRCYNQMREKYRYFSAIDSAQNTEQVTESFMVTRRTKRSSLDTKPKLTSEFNDEEFCPPTAAPNGELLFSEKYKPLLLEQVLVNLSPVNQLKDFLSYWTNGSANGRNTQTADAFDFMDLNDSNSSQQKLSANTVVLLGPISSGKTSAVFALANEMNFNVLEINAGMKRTGKRLIQDLQEATQSHQIRKESTAVAGCAAKNLLKVSLNGLKSKASIKRKNSNPPSAKLETMIDSNSTDQACNSTRKSLILIEDADVVFDQTDAGFIDAIHTLAASSKRPVIIVASNPNCDHLQKLIQQNTIHFKPPNVLNITKFLAILSLIENCPVKMDDLISLYLYNQLDLRRTLHELQFFIQSGGDRLQSKLLPTNENPEKRRAKTDSASLSYFTSPRKRQFSIEQEISNVASTIADFDETQSNSEVQDSTVYTHCSLFEFYAARQNNKCLISCPVNFRLLSANLTDIFRASEKLQDARTWTKDNCSKSVKRKSRSPKKQWLNSATQTSNSVTPLGNLCRFYENLSISSLCDKQLSSKHCILNGIEPQTKSAFSAVDRLLPHLSEDISHFLLEQAIEVNLHPQPCAYDLFVPKKLSRSLCEELGPDQFRNMRARYLDYEPCLRSICRSEKLRATTERRSTRFYHYLRNYTVNVTNFSNAHFEEACDVFQDAAKST
uniref:AAA+ ATPase domain-containing protein n=1 Tax=Glossina brevipalpis TaxID=37001 RepID=A0A1A9WGH6_9MUSC